MASGKMDVLVNPGGVCFNPASIAGGLQAALDVKVYTEAALFRLNETWNCWDFHSRFSHTVKEQALDSMNKAVRETGMFLRQASWLVVTFGSAYQYFTTALAGTPGYGVANCHKAPGNWFEKEMLTVEAMLATWQQLIERLRVYNPGLRLLLTVSPVRHIRDGLPENNRSKGRLLELAHLLAEAYEHCYYFPAYELVTDVLRDYRFYEQDMAHPNSQAVEFVWDAFRQACMTAEDRQLMEKINAVVAAAQHRPRFPDTQAAAAFRAQMLQKISSLQEAYPYLSFRQEQEVFLVR